MKRIISVFAGLATAFITFMLFELISSKIYPLPQGIHPGDHDAMKDYIAGLSNGAFILILAGYITGSFLAGVVVKAVSKSTDKKPAYIVGVLLTVGGLINFMTIPHPVWMAVIGTLCYVPMVLAGFSVIKPK